jgi:hypothetical protein
MCYGLNPWYLQRFLDNYIVSTPMDLSLLQKFTGTAVGRAPLILLISALQKSFFDSTESHRCNADIGCNVFLHQAAFQLRVVF